MAMRRSLFGLIAAIPLVAATPLLVARADCTTITVNSGDSCSSLASRCGISGSDFTTYNGNICSSLQPGQKVCCSAGTVPKPQQNSDGSCASYTVKSGDTCGGIAGANGISTTDLATFNDKTTWGWAGCSNLYANTNICVSAGTPPLPQPVQGAVCGPTKPGTQKTSSDLASLNPCPINGCCSRWGQCGATPDYCTISSGPTGNPGTGGCVSNCGTAITNVKSGAAVNVAYYESWSEGRSCARMHADDLDVTKYTHYHWAFVNPDVNGFLTVNDTYGEWKRFLAMKNIKRIISIGGWDFSQGANASVLPKLMRDPERFAKNVVFFLNIYGLDGVDIDWEYPTANNNDGLWYLYFLFYLRSNIAKGMTISIAAPSAYGTLMNYPIANMASFVDYIVFMTYDYHGTWDYGVASDGCPNGSCLRSHVNLTETSWSLGMITKAGVTTDKIVVGVSSYGRSFSMSDPSCTGPTCTFTNKTPAVGTCTQQAGFLANAEINIFKAWGVKSTYDQSSDSDWVIVPGNTWVSYMSDATKASRQSRWKANSFAGTADWAVSMQNW